MINNDVMLQAVQNIINLSVDLFSNTPLFYVLASAVLILAIHIFNLLLKGGK